MFSFTRREFLQILGTSTLGATAAFSRWFSLEEVSQEAPISLSPTFCEICFWKCSGWVYKRGNQLWKIVGNERDEHCHGRLCTRGTGGIGAYTDPDRLSRPLRRVKKGGKQKFVPVSWEEALDFVADRLQEIRKKEGPESLALFTHGIGGYFLKTLFKAMGCYNIAAPSYAQCRGPREEAFRITFGRGLGSPENTDIENTKCLVLIGCHIGENLHNGQVQEFAKALERGATIITVDPRFSVAASKSKYWLPLRPGTDLALLLSWIHLLIYEVGYDKEYVQKHTYGFEKLKEEVKGYTPHWASEITGLPKNLIVKTAIEMKLHSPAVIVHPSRHTTWYGDDTQRVRAIAILNALLGSFGRKGGFYFPEKAKVPKYPIPKFPKPRKTWRDFLPKGSYPLAREVPANVLRDLSIPTGKGKGPIRSWFVYATNLPKTLPEPEKTYRAIQHLDLLVVVDILPMKITGWADVVLPECSYLERYDDLRISPGRKPQIALRMPALPPKHESKPNWWIAKELAKRLDLEAYFPWKDIEEYLDWRLRQIGSSLEEMKKIGVKELPESYPKYLDEKEEIFWKTPTGKIELYSTILEKYGFDPIPRYQAHPTPPKDYRRLLYGRAPFHSFSRTINNPLLHELMPENEVWIHPATAREWNVQSGEYIRLKNQDGVISDPIKVRVTHRIHPEAVYMVHGFGHKDNRLRRAYRKGADENQLITQVKIDPLMGGTGLRVNFVTLYRD